MSYYFYNLKDDFREQIRELTEDVGDVDRVVTRVLKIFSTVEDLIDELSSQIDDLKREGS